jgi:hypothetical protein
VRRPNASEETIQQVAALTAAGSSSRQVEAETDVPRRTVSRWVNRPEVAQIIKERTEQLALAYSERMAQRFDATEGDHKALTGHQLPIDYGIVMDKYAKISGDGESTSRQPDFVMFIEGNVTIQEKE